MAIAQTYHISLVNQLVIRKGSRRVNITRLDLEKAEHDAEIALIDKTIRRYESEANLQAAQRARYDLTGGF